MIDKQLVKEHLQFTSTTFPKGTARGAALHAEREIAEVLSDMSDNAPIESLTEEFADVLGCIIDSVHRSDITVDQINEAFRKKLEKNKARKWKDNGDGSYSHIKQQQ